MNEFKRKIMDYLGISEDDLPSLIKKVTYEDLESPYAFKNMEMAKNRILEAIKNNEKIMIYGDYDCDGISATSIMVKMFQYLGVKVGYYIPSRYIDGYGINLQRANQIVEKDYNLVITVDNGVAQDEALNYLKEKNIDVILTDHHAIIRDIPPCYCIIHPYIKENGETLKECGAYVAFMISIAVLGRIDDYLLTLALCATISDMMPLKSYNRDLVKLGLQIINSNRMLPYHSLNNNAFPLNEDSFGFNICPKINAVGRVKEDMSVNDLIRFFVSEDIQVRNKILRVIDDVNNQRKYIMNEALSTLDLSKYENEKVIVERFDNISEGVIGLIAARIMNECKKPCIVLTKIHNEDILKGSSRSFEGFSIEELFINLSSYLIAYGGHAAAGGLSLKEDNYIPFKQAVNEYVKDKEIVPVKEKYIEVISNELTYDNYLFLNSLSPFGMDFPQPKFSLKINANDIIYIGDKKQHIRGYINKQCSFIGFNIADKVSPLKDEITIVGSINYDDFKKGFNIVFRVLDVLN